MIVGFADTVTSSLSTLVEFVDMKILLVTCSYCDVGVYSRCAGDVRSCECGNVRIKSDELQTFVLDAQKNSFTVDECEISATAETLKEDFDEMRERFGRVRDGKSFAKRLRFGPVQIKKRERYVDQVL